MVTSVPMVSSHFALRSSDRSQCTIAGAATVQGIGFVTGADVTVRFLPADADTGLFFVRTDLPQKPHLPVDIRYVVPRRLRTTLELGDAKVEMTEHILASLAGLGIDNCIIEIDGPEAPGMDGSAQAFVEAILKAGVLPLGASAVVYDVDAPISVSENNASVTIEPTDDPGLIVTYTLDYGVDLPLGRQTVSFPVRADPFRRTIAPARTFVLERDIEALKSQGLGTRTSLRDLLVLSSAGKPIDNEFRFADECARHKVLDVIGDLAMLGMPIRGHVRAEKSGHWLNAALVRRLKEDLLQRATGRQAA